MSHPARRTPSPLSIPDNDSEGDLGLDASLGSCTRYRRCPSLKADCLRSPVDPKTWEGASYRARFGLDIGGTLCKVVYFEPFDCLESCTSSIDICSTSAAVLAESWAGKIGETEDVDVDAKLSVSRRANANDAVQENKNTLLSCEESEQKTPQRFCQSEDCLSTFRLLQGEQDGEEFGTASSTVLDKGENSIQNCPCSYHEGRSENSSNGSSQVRQPSIGSDDPSNTKCDCTNGKLDTCTGEGTVGGERMTKAKHLNQAHKIWVSSHDPVLLPGRGTLYFKCFETWRMEEFLFLTKEYSLVTAGRALGATGGGARKFGHQFLEIAGLQLKRADELRSLVRGIGFLMRHAQHESFEYPKGSFQGGVIQRPFRSPGHSSDDSDNFSEEGSLHSIYQLDDGRPGLEETCLSNDNPHEPNKLEDTVGGKKMRAMVVPQGPNESGGWHEGNRNLYPYLVVNIGSGVSILLVDSPEQFQRVGGTSLGGSTFFGLTSVLTGCSSFEEAIDLAAEGDSTEIDMLVGDIYGGDYLEMGLAATTVASSFGKVMEQLVQPARRAAALKTPQHLAKATLLMITNNIGSLAKLHAQATGVEHVLFTGSFMHGNKLAMRLLAVAMEFWSKGQIKAIFLRHEGHAGAMGALLSTLNPTNSTDALLLT